ncbi:hypothetical protein HOP60_09265 [Halomonas daqingensis]|uniref:Transposase n=1 Tax=Billgrantia desiderata TaxID=52021 RepID=A0ABS9B411_9GAMM|nr:hypothetical protein [Halomonas desiderata]MCE8046922.1 hypothetical protein [Halomonas desiderata]
MKRRDRLDERERATLSWLSSQLLNTTIVWYLKEKAQKIWKGIGCEVPGPVGKSGYSWPRPLIFAR